jgi:hypothetical protein
MLTRRAAPGWPKLGPVSDGYLQPMYPDDGPDGFAARLRPGRRRRARRATSEAEHGMYDRLPHLNESERRHGCLGTVAVLVAVVTLLWFYLQPYLGHLVSGGL